jgi:hypothetical protein
MEGHAVSANIKGSAATNDWKATSACRIATAAFHWNSQRIDSIDSSLISPKFRACHRVALKKVPGMDLNTPGQTTG